MIILWFKDYSGESSTENWIWSNIKTSEEQVCQNALNHFWTLKCAGMLKTNTFQNCQTLLLHVLIKYKIQTSVGNKINKASYLHLHSSHPHDIIFEDDGHRVGASWAKRDREMTRWVFETGMEGQLGDSLLLEHRVLGLEKFAFKCKETRKLQWTKHQPFSQLTTATKFRFI